MNKKRLVKPLHYKITVTMLKIGNLSFLTIALYLLFSGAVFGASDGFPAPSGAINDFAGVIDSSSAQKMESVAGEVWDKTRTAIVVAVMESIGDNTPEDYANRLYQAWGIGEKGKDKGVLIFLAVKERKIRIETGYGVEGILPDGLVGEILDRYMLPYLKEGQYGKGLTNGVVAVASIIAKDAHVELSGMPANRLQAKPFQRTVKGFFPVILIIAVILLIGTRQGRELLPFLIIMLMGSGRGGGYGGSSGGFGGGFGGFGGGFSGGGGAGRDF